MRAKYHTIVTDVCDMAAEFADAGILVFFGPDAPEELHQFAILTEASKLRADVEVGDIVVIDDAPFPALCVGPIANQNLANLGHLVVKFNGLLDPELPGDISLPAVPAPPVKPGTVIEITGGGA
jgi:glucitol/sorbitol PTS system EIIA component